VIRLWQLPIEELPSNPALVGEIRRYLGHAAGINFITLSPDGKSFLTGSSGELWLWDIDKDTERVRFPDAAGNIMDAGFSLDGQRVIGPAQIGTVVVWDVKPGEKAKEAARFKIDNWVESAFALSDPARVFYANRFGGRIYDLDKKAELPARFLGERAVRSKDGKRILSADGKALYLWDASGKELSNVELPGAPFRIALASDGKLALAAVGNNVHQWDMDAKKEGKRLDTPASVYAVAISPDGKRALTGGFDKKLRLWDLATGKELHCFHDHTGPVSAVAFLPDGRQALSGSSDKSIRLWQLSDESAPARTEVGEVRTYLGHDGPVASVAFAPDGKSFLSGSAGEIFQWDPGSSKPRHRFADKAKPLKTFGHYALVTRISFSKDGSHAITGGVEQPVRIWDVAKGQVVKYVDVPKAASHFVAWSPDDKYLLVAPSGTFVRLFAFPSLDESNDRFGGSQGHFSRDGNILLTLERGVLQTYQLDKPRRTFVNVRDINVCALTPDGRYAVCGGLDSMIYVWDMVAKKQIHKMPGHKGTIQAIAISPDGKRALTGSGNDSTLRLWDLVAGKEIRSFEGHTGSIVSISFSPDGTQALTAGSTDKSIKLWQLPD
jgi:WD40 repeat protein